ncbi:MAG TPA: ABC transporter ATP-binding protein [Acidimicrobiia bacterium]|jgi:ABC-2 type transport system ATP-binding protein
MIVEFQSVEKRYGKVHALKDADLEVPEGATLGLIGPNGAGKTTSMLIMTSLLQRDGGKVRIGGIDPERDPRAVRRHVGYMPDFFGVYEGLRSREYLEFFAASHNVRSAARAAVVADLLALVDLEDKADADVNSLSRGMKQRLSLARALIHDPELLVLDEPASGLDPRARVGLRELISELSRMGRTVVISSHILSELEGICSHLAIVDLGRVLAMGSVDEIRSKLFGQRRVIARVAEMHVERTEALLRTKEDLSDLDVERGQVSFSFSGGDEISAALLSEVVGAGVPVVEWRVQSAGLEELFMQLTNVPVAGAARPDEAPVEEGDIE